MVKISAISKWQKSPQFYRQAAAGPSDGHIGGSIYELLLAFVLLSAGFMIGIQPLILNGDDILNAVRQGTIQTEQGVMVKEVFENGQKAGLLPGDKIVAVDSRKLLSSNQLTTFLNTVQNKEITLDILRGNERKSLKLRAGEKTWL